MLLNVLQSSNLRKQLSLDPLRNETAETQVKNNNARTSVIMHACRYVRNTHFQRVTKHMKLRRNIAGFQSENETLQ